MNKNDAVEIECKFYNEAFEECDEENSVVQSFKSTTLASIDKNAIGEENFTYFVSFTKRGKLYNPENTDFGFKKSELVKKPVKQSVYDNYCLFLRSRKDRYYNLAIRELS